MRIEVIREGKAYELNAVLGSMSEGLAPIPGIELSNLTPQNREKFDVPDAIHGVLVSSSTGETETFKKGVVLVEINGTKILDVKDVSENLYSGINRFYVCVPREISISSLQNTLIKILIYF